jgi:hypothetical protein
MDSHAGPTGGRSTRGGRSAAWHSTTGHARLSRLKLSVGRAGYLTLLRSPSLSRPRPRSLLTAGVFRCRLAISLGCLRLMPAGQPMPRACDRRKSLGVKTRRHAQLHRAARGCQYRDAAKPGPGCRAEPCVSSPKSQSSGYTYDPSRAAQKCAKSSLVWADHSGLELAGREIVTANVPAINSAAARPPKYTNEHYLRKGSYAKKI